MTVCLLFLDHHQEVMTEHETIKTTNSKLTDQLEGLQNKLQVSTGFLERERVRRFIPHNLSFTGTKQRTLPEKSSLKKD